MADIPGQTYLTRPLAAARYSVSERTISRWMEDEALGFPAPIRVRERLFFALADLEAWERRQAGPGRKAA